MTDAIVCPLPFLTAGLRGSRAACAISAMAAWSLVGCGPTASPPASDRPALRAEHVEGHDGHDEQGHDDKDHDEHGHDEHDHDHPESVAAGLVKVDSSWSRVREALDKGDRDAADDVVHAAGHLLEDLESLVAKEQDEAREAGQKALREIFECFDTLDVALHGAEDDWKKLDLDALGSRIAAALGQLGMPAKGGDR